MNATTEDLAEVRASQDFKKLDSLLQVLVEQPCLRAEFSYGDELVVRFGPPIPHKHPRLAGKTRGTWELRTLATPWAVFPLWSKPLGYVVGLPPHENPAVEIDKSELDAVLKTLAGSRVVEVKAGAGLGDLGIRFKNGVSLALLARYAERDADLPVWEMTMPKGRSLEVFGEPLPTWSLRTSGGKQDRKPRIGDPDVSPLEEPPHPPED